MRALWKEKILPLLEIEGLSHQWRAHNKSFATLNGSFDLLHAGHLYIFFEAAKRADLLIVALNSDLSIQQYKGPQRPIIPLKERLEMVASLACVDYVTWFDEATPCALLERLRPHIHVNGAEYGTNCIEAEVVAKGGGRLHLVERIEGLSTSALINKIHRLCD